MVKINNILTVTLNNIIQYGIPLDDRSTFTKTDWLMWVAALGNSTQVSMHIILLLCSTLHYNPIVMQFDTIVNAVYKFANETPDRVPFTDW